MPVTVRPATEADLDAIAALTAAHRRALAAWSPVWWRAAPGADEVHRMWLGYLIGAPDRRVLVAAAAARGDTLVAVVVGADDADLAQVLASVGFERTVEVYAWP